MGIIVITDANYGAVCNFARAKAVAPAFGAGDLECGASV